MRKALSEHKLSNKSAPAIVLILPLFSPLLPYRKQGARVQAGVKTLHREGWLKDIALLGKKSQWPNEAFLVKNHQTDIIRIQVCVYVSGWNVQDRARTVCQLISKDKKRITDGTSGNNCRHLSNKVPELEINTPFALHYYIIHIILPISAVCVPTLL